MVMERTSREIFTVKKEVFLSGTYRKVVTGRKCFDKI
jgi:hypothetical protein